MGLSGRRIDIGLIAGNHIPTFVGLAAFAITSNTSYGLQWSTGASRLLGNAGRLADGSKTTRYLHMPLPLPLGTDSLWTLSLKDSAHARWDRTPNPREAYSKCIFSFAYRLRWTANHDSTGISPGENKAEEGRIRVVHDFVGIILLAVPSSYFVSFSCTFFPCAGNATKPSTFSRCCPREVRTRHCDAASSFKEEGAVQHRQWPRFLTSRTVFSRKLRYSEDRISHNEMLLNVF